MKCAENDNPSEEKMCRRLEEMSIISEKKSWRLFILYSPYKIYILREKLYKYLSEKIRKLYEEKARRKKIYLKT